MSYIMANDITFGGIVISDIEIAGEDSTIFAYGILIGNIELGQGSDSLDLRYGHFTGDITVNPNDPGEGNLPGGSTGAYTDVIKIGDDATTVSIVAGDPNLNLTVESARGATTVQFDIASTDASVVHNADGSYTVSAGVDGTETLINVQKLVFTDTTVNLTVTPVNANDFHGDGRSDFLIEATNGALVVGEVDGADHANYAQIGALGSEWSFVAQGPFLGDAKSDFLIKSTSGAIVVGEIGSGGQATYTQIGALGSEWNFHGSGDFLSDGKDGFLIENTSGVLVVGEIGAGDVATYTAIGAVGSEWTLHGTGDFNADGQDGFLMENTSGALVVGEVGAGNHATYVLIGAIGPEWTILGTGDFLGEGQTDFLMVNTSGALVVGETEIPGDQAQYTLVGSLASGSHLVGFGDYLGEGHDQFLIETAAGIVDVADVVNGQLHTVAVGQLGSEWSFH
jgi:hypothetical protein